MAPVAMVALAMGGSQWVGEMKKRRAWYRIQAAESRRREEDSLRHAHGWNEIHEHLMRTVKAGDLDREHDVEQAESIMFAASAAASRHAKERELYEHLAAHPWEPRPADPQERVNRRETLLLFEPSPGVRFDFSAADCARVALSVVISAAGCGYLIHTNLVRFQRRRSARPAGADEPA